MDVNVSLKRNCLNGIDKFVEFLICKKNGRDLSLKINQNLNEKELNGNRFEKLNKFYLLPWNWMNVKRKMKLHF